VNVAIEKASNVCYYYDTRGQIYMAMDRNDDALKDLNHSLSIDPNYIEALVSRSNCYRKLAEVEKVAEKKAELISKAEADEQKAEALKKEDKK
jgi:tetratricopeptide (TPR) repeat protein